MNRKFWLAIILLVIVVVAVLAYFMMNSNLPGISSSKQGSVSSADSQQITNTADLIPDNSDVNIGDVI